MRFPRSLALGAFIALPLLASIPVVEATTLYMKGDVIYRERMALPENAEVEVALADATVADRAPTIIAKTRFAATSASPIAYELKFDSNSVKLKNKYVLQAQIVADKRVLFATTDEHQVFSGDANDTQIFVARVTDAPENKGNSETNLIGNWKIVAIENEKVTGRAPVTLLIGADGRISGHAGCNNYGGSIKIDKDKVSFGQMMSTRMACDETLMKQEAKLLKTFGKIHRFSVTADELTLLDAQKKVILKLNRDK